MPTEREVENELRRQFEWFKSTFLKDAKAQHEPQGIIRAIEAVTFEEVADSYAADGFNLDAMGKAFVAAAKKHEGPAEAKLAYLNLHGSLWRQFITLMNARAGSGKTADGLRELLQEYDRLAPPPEAEKLHSLGRQSLQIAYEGASLSINNRDLKGAAAKFKQLERLEGEAAREWERLAGQR